MSLGPIDLKMAIPKTQELSKVEQNNQEKSKFVLQAQADQQNKDIEKSLKQVNENEELSKSKIDQEEERQRQEQDKEKEKENSLDTELLLGHDNSTGKVGKDSNVGVKLDIKI